MVFVIVRPSARLRVSRLVFVVAPPVPLRPRTYAHGVHSGHKRANLLFFSQTTNLLLCFLAFCRSFQNTNNVSTLLLLTYVRTDFPFLHAEAVPSAARTAAVPALRSASADGGNPYPNAMLFKQFHHQEVTACGGTFPGFATPLTGSAPVSAVVPSTHENEESSLL